MGIIDLRKMGDHYLKLRHIHERVLSIIESYLPDELAIEAPFFREECTVYAEVGACTRCCHGGRSQPGYTDHGICSFKN